MFHQVIRATIAALFLLPVYAHAGPIIDSSGQLLGATGVQVGSNFFDVEFLDGSCIDVFTGCDEQSDFAFNNEVDAQAFGEALLDAVFIDAPGTPNLFDSDPSLTNGCVLTTQCLVFIPFELADSNEFEAIIVSNLAPGAFGSFDDSIRPTLGEGGILRDGATLISGNPRVFAAVTPATAVPDPVAMPLFLSALAGLGVMRRRKLKAQIAA